ISNGVIVISKYFNGEEHFYRDIDGKTYYSGPLVVLTSRATASAAEIVAQALQDYGVAIVVGDESTYGKGTIQNQTVTSEQNGLPQFKVTVGKYYTVSGKTPQLEGVKADIVIPSIYSQEHLGEQYLEFTVPNDTIPNEYADDLSDIPNSLRAWYLRYYVPTLQHQAFFWHNALPQLRTESAKRLSSNSDYQYYLRRIQEKRPMTFFKKNKEGRSTPVDFQKDEGVAIVKDMIDLEAQERHKPIANGNLKE
ncbi:MAG: S41 family peptidase, partial [Pseudomonadota bacterium]